MNVTEPQQQRAFDWWASIAILTYDEQPGFPWCGFLIDMTDLSVSTDYSRYRGNCWSFSLCSISDTQCCYSGLQDSLTVNKGRRPGTVFMQNMLRSIVCASRTIIESWSCRNRQTKFRSHIIYCDSDLNSKHTVYINIYQNFVLVAMKMHLYIHDWGISTKKSSKFIRGMSHALLCSFRWNGVIRLCASSHPVHICNDEEQSIK